MNACIVCNKPVKCLLCGGSGGYYALDRDNIADWVECECTGLLLHKHTRTEKKHARLAAWAGEECAGIEKHNQSARQKARYESSQYSAFDAIESRARSSWRYACPKNVFKQEHSDVMEQLRDRTARRAFEVQERTLKEAGVK